MHLEQLAKGILLVLVIISVFTLIGYFQPLGSAIKNLPCKYLDLCQDVETLQDIQRFKQSPVAFTKFLEEYKVCKVTTTNGCLCNLTIPLLPEGVFISVRNENLFTNIALCAGESTSATEYECTQDHLLKEEDISSDVLLIPTEKPTSLANPLELYTIKDKKLDLTRYQEARAVLVKTEETTKVYADTGLKEIDFYKVYKKDSVTMAFVPPLGSFGALVGTFGQTNVKEYLTKNIPVCTTSAGAQEAVIAFDMFSKELRKCVQLYLKEKKESDPFFILLNSPTEKALAVMQYELERDGQGHWKNKKLYALHLTQGWFASIPLAPPNLEQKEVGEDIKQQIEKMLNELKTKNAQQGAAYLKTFDQAVLSTETQEMLKTEKTVTIDTITALEENIKPRTDVGVCGSVETKLPQGFAIVYTDHTLLLKQGTKTLKQTQMPIVLRQAQQQNAPQEATEVLTTHTFDQETLWVEFMRYADGSVAFYPFTLEQVTQEAQKRAYTALEDQNL